jgi:hypothetical protein
MLTGRPDYRAEGIIELFQGILPGKTFTDDVTLIALTIKKRREHDFGIFALHRRRAGRARHRRGVARGSRSLPEDAAARSLFWYLWCVTLCLRQTAPNSSRRRLLDADVRENRIYLLCLYPAAWLWFSLRYTNWLDKLSRTSLLAAIFVPAILVVLVFTNDWHRLMWPHIAYLESEGLSVLRADHGPIFWALWAYSWLLLGAGSLIVFRSHFSGQLLYKKQSLWILGGMLMPGITNTVYVFHLIPGLQKDFTPSATPFRDAAFSRACTSTVCCGSCR